MTGALPIFSLPKTYSKTSESPGVRPEESGTK